MSFSGSQETSSVRIWGLGILKAGIVAAGPWSLSDLISAFVGVDMAEDQD